MSQYNGLIAATVTPTHNDGSINVSVIPDYIDYLISNGVHAVFVNGSTGEWCSFSTNERKLIAEAWICHGREKLKYIIIHCGALSLTDSKDLSKHAAVTGANAIACIAPNFLKPHNEEYLVDFLSEVASAAPKCPFLYYHIPPLTRIQINMAEFLTLANRDIPNFCGLKLSTLDFTDVYCCMEFNEKILELYYGYDEQLLSALVVGIKGAVGNYYNFLGKEFTEMVADYKKGNIEVARDRQVKIVSEFVPLFKKYGDGLTKLLMTFFSGKEMGPSRLPMKTNFSDTEVRSIRKYLEDKGYL